MIDFRKEYELAKQNANIFMSCGDITNYFESLLQMNKYKHLMLAIMAN